MSPTLERKAPKLLNESTLSKDRFSHNIWKVFVIVFARCFLLRLSTSDCQISNEELTLTRWKLLTLNLTYSNIGPRQISALTFSLCRHKELRYLDNLSWAPCQRAQCTRVEISWPFFLFYRRSWAAFLFWVVNHITISGLKRELQCGISKSWCQKFNLVWLCFN